MNGDRCRRELRAADVLTAGNHAGNQRADGRGLLRSERRAVEHVARHHALLDHILHVHGRGRSGNRDRFLDGADAQVGIHRGGEGSGQLDALAFDAAEAGEGERHGVAARPQVDDLVLAGRVTDDRPDLLDQGGTGGFDGHARKHRAGRVFHDAGDTAATLRGRPRRGTHDHRECDEGQDEGSLHACSLKDPGQSEVAVGYTHFSVRKPSPAEKG